MVSNALRVVIPCAGQGGRFRAQGYQQDKALITVAGRRMIEWALDPLPDAWQRYFVVRFDQGELIGELERLNGYIHVLPARSATQGAALTVLSVAVALPPDEPVMVLNCDQFFQADLIGITAAAEGDGLAGYILTFPGTGPQWSYALVDDHGYVTRVLEKIEAPRSQATVGAYWWARTGDLVESICRMVAAGDRTRGEYYLAPAYNHLPGGLHGRNLVRAVPVREFLGLGTPEQLRDFLAAAVTREW